MRHKISLTVNGKSCNLEVDSQRTLLDVLRRDLALTGTKEGCGMGDCGTCTVLLNGKPINSCLTLAVEADGQKIETIEGVASDGKLHPIQQAFIDHGGVQCGHSLKSKGTKD